MIPKCSESLKYTIWAAAVVFSGCSLSYLFNLMTEEKVFSQGAFAVLVFAVLACVLPIPYKRWKQIEDHKKRKRRIMYDSVVSLALALSFVMGYQMRMLGMTSSGVKGKLFILVVSAGIGLGFIPLADLWFGLLDGRMSSVISRGCSRSNADTASGEKSSAGAEKAASAKKAEGVGESGTLRKPCRAGRCFLIGWTVIFACWIPVFLAYYPAIMSYDFHRQSQEATQGYIWFNTHHPLIHTALIRWFLLLGEALGAYELGMALFSIMQMLILSAAMAYSGSMIGRLTGKKWPVVVTVLVFALLPVHPVLALSMTKDILFSAFFLFFMVLMVEYRMCEKGLKKWLLLTALAVNGILMMMLRNNAVYAFAIFAVFYILWSKKERLRILFLCAVILAGAQGIKSGMQTAMQAGSGSQMEMYSVFVQQMCRTALYCENSMDPVMAATIGYYVPYEYWGDYNPALADSIKGNITVTSFQNWKDDIPGMLKSWAKLGLQYPNEYIDAFLAMTSGYWFLDDVSHAEVLGYGEDTNLGLLYTFNASVSDVFEGVESHTYFPGLLKLYQKIVNGNCYYSWPVINNLFKPAFYCWAMVLVMISLLHQKKAGKLVLCMLPFLYLLTLLLGPVVNMRYVYPIMVCVPFMLAWLFEDGISLPALQAVSGGKGENEDEKLAREAE